MLVSNIAPFPIHFCADCFWFKNLLDKVQNSTTIYVGNEVKRFPAKQKKRSSSQMIPLRRKKDQTNVCFKSEKKEQHRRDVLVYSLEHPIVVLLK